MSQISSHSKQSTRDANAPRRVALGILRMQGAVIVALLLLVIALPVTWPKSVLAGGLISVIAQGWFSYRALRSGSQIDGILQSLYVGMAGKFALSVLLFAVVFAMHAKGKLEIDPLWLMLGFLLLQAVVWFAPLLLKQTATPVNDD